MLKIFFIVGVGMSYIFAQSLPFSEDFEDSDVSEWQLYRVGEEALQAVDMSSAPTTLFNGGNKVGYLQDSDASYSGAAIALVGETTDQNYTIDGDVYVYQNHAGGSAYTGLVVYADSSFQGSASHGYYVKLVADFDASNRFRLYNNQMNNSTFQYSFHHSIDASNVDQTEGWHHMAVEVKTLDDGTTEYTAYYDGQNLGSYIDDSIDRVASGQYGAYAFQMDDDGIAGYYDNIVVTSDAELAIDPFDNPEIPKSISLNQNYPNPFNPTTTISFDLNQRTNISLDIFNLNGQFIINLISGNYGPKHYSVIWNGKNNRGRVVPAGMYLYTLSNGSERVSQKMLFLK
jgi:hypothetical protein